jgi:hypothetical protein
MLNWLKKVFFPADLTEKKPAVKKKSAAKKKTVAKKAPAKRGRPKQSK